jgi:hypothetical protein
MVRIKRNWMRLICRVTVARFSRVLLLNLIVAQVIGVPEKSRGVTAGLKAAFFGSFGHYLT